jgi:TolA-binding protein
MTQPLSAQFEKLLMEDPELTAAEERMRVMRNSEEMVRQAKARLEAVARQVAETAKHKELCRLQQAAQNLKQQTNPEFFFKELEGQRGQQVTLPLGWQVATYNCAGIAPAAGAFPRTAEEFAKYAANRPPLRIDD